MCTSAWNTALISKLTLLLNLLIFVAFFLDYLQTCLGTNVLYLYVKKNILFIHLLIIYSV